MSPLATLDNRRRKIPTALTQKDLQKIQFLPMPTPFSPPYLHFRYTRAIDGNAPPKGKRPCSSRKRNRNDAHVEREQEESQDSGC